jgi:putative hydrolase of the HAD superfamily
MPVLKRIQAVSFDVGGTLLEPWPSVGHVYAAVAAEHGHVGLAPDLLDRQFAYAYKHAADFDHSRAAWRGMVQATFAGQLSPTIAAALLDPLYERFAQAGAWRIFDDVLPTLTALRARGLRLAVVSNWDERLRPLLTDLGLTSFFEVIVISREVGHAKPAGEIFRHCLEALRLPPGRVLHVGDSQEEDVRGARRLGLRALHLHRKSSSPPRGAIVSLAQILSRLTPAGEGQPAFLTGVL